MLTIWHHEGPEIDSPPGSHKFLTEGFSIKILQVKFWQQKIQNIFQAKVPLRHWESNPQPLYRQTAWGTTIVSVCCFVVFLGWSFVIHREDWLSIKFGENDSFRKLFLFFENTFQYVDGISHDILGSHFNSRRSLTSANRRQIVSDLPGRFFLSALLSLVIRMTGRSERSARALRDGADVVREAKGNEFCVRISFFLI